MCYNGWAFMVGGNITMHEILDIKHLIDNARLRIEEGKYEFALTTLQHVETNDPEQQSLITYFAAWCHIRLEHWTEARCQLSHLYLQSSIEEGWNDAKHNERERRAFYLFCLGNAAIYLNRIEEASQHYTQCLTLLSERRVKLPQVRIKARHSLGMACILSGLYAMAIQHYEEALHLCKHYPEYENLPEIYYGLCEANRLLEKFDSAYTHGIKALELCEKRGMRDMEGRIQYMLGQICYQMHDYNEAADHYLKSLSIATQSNNPQMRMGNFTALADLRLAEDSLEEAQHFCQNALEVVNETLDDYDLGLLYFTCGKVTLAEYQQAQAEQPEILFSRARTSFEKAKEHLSQTQASALLGEIDGRIAQMLEQSGHTQEAISYWRAAYEALSEPHRQSVMEWIAS
jgi:tetratricopeptide (TPR) repeat protein